MALTQHILPAGGTLIITVLVGLAFYLPLLPGDLTEPTPSEVLVVAGGLFNFTDQGVYMHKNVEVYQHPKCSIPNYPEDFQPHSIDMFRGVLTMCGIAYDHPKGTLNGKPKDAKCLQLVYLGWWRGTWKEIKYTADLGLTSHKAWITEQGLRLVGTAPLGRNDDGQWSYGLALPSPGYVSEREGYISMTYGSCLIQDNEKLIVTGGRTKGEEYAPLSHVTQYTEDGDHASLPDLKTARELHACGKFNLRGNEVYLVVGGAKNLMLETEENGGLVSTEIFENGVWREGPPLPEVRIGCVGAEVDGKFYLSGGNNDKGEILDEVLSFNPYTESWDVEEKLQSPRELHAANSVPYESLQEYC